MKECFTIANSFAAPFCSDESTHYMKGKTAHGQDAVLTFDVMKASRMYEAKIL